MAELKRALGFWTILSLAVANIMGTGMFFGVSIGASYSGNASILSWIIMTIVGVYISMFFGELVAMFPSAGGIYEYSKQAYNKFTSFLVAWIAWIVGNITVALMVVAAINYIMPDNSYFLIKISLSILLILALNLIALYGVEASGVILILLSSISIGVVLAVIFPGIFHMDINNLTPFFSNGILPVFVTIFFIAESFFGWEGSTYLAEETKNPEKIIPLSLIIGTLIVGGIGILAAIVSLGIIPWQEIMNSNSPLSDVFGVMFGSGAMKIINIGVFIALMGSAAGGIIGMPRLLLALARDKLFISQFATIHPKFKTPHKAIFFQTIIMLLIMFMAFGNYTLLLSLLLPLGMIMYIFTILAVLVLRIKHPHLKREFKAPFAKIGSILISLFLLSLILVWLYLEPTASTVLLLGISLILIGIPIYILLLFYYNPDAIVKIHNLLAYLTLLTEKIIMPKKEKKEIIKLLGDVKNKAILEYGCSVGTLTLDLAESVKPQGKVYATDLSENDLVITKKRMIKKGHMHVTVIHDEHQVNRIHPDIPHVEAIVSIGMMGYMQDVKKILKEMREILPYKGKIVFVDYVDFFKFIPNVEWLSSDKKIEEIFRECGFSVYVKRKKGLFWNYVYVYGMKFHHNIPYV